MAFSIRSVRRVEKPPSWYRNFILQLADSIYTWHSSLSLRIHAAPTQQNDAQERPIRVVCISDTHNTEPELPDGDLLLHAGDLSQEGTFAEIQAQLDWMNSQRHTHKVVIAGNHDLLLDAAFVDAHPKRIFEREGCKREDLRWGDVIYLNDNSVTLAFSPTSPHDDDEGHKGTAAAAAAAPRSLKIYGSPTTQQFGTWAFQVSPIRDIWTHTVPDDVDILLTHGPPKFHLDAQQQGNAFLGKELCRVRPALVAFGHIHSGYGRESVVFDDVKCAYDGVRNTAEREVVGKFLGLIWSVVISFLCGALVRGFAKSRATRLVNAAVVGGHRNQDRRSPVVVDI